MRAALKDALRAREPLVVAVLRQALAAIDNAEAADVGAAPPAEPGVIAGGVAGLGAGEVPRRVLTAEAVTALMEREAQELRDAASAYSAMGKHEEARAVRRQLEVLDSLR